MAAALARPQRAKLAYSKEQLLAIPAPDATLHALVPANIVYSGLG